jgi:hypothetical protein
MLCNGVQSTSDAASLLLKIWRMKHRMTSEACASSCFSDAVMMVVMVMMMMMEGNQRKLLPGVAVQVQVE